MSSYSKRLRPQDGKETAESPGRRGLPQTGSNVCKVIDCLCLAGVPFGPFRDGYEVGGGEWLPHRGMSDVAWRSVAAREAFGSCWPLPRVLDWSQI